MKYFDKDRLERCIKWVKFYPVLMQVIILANIFDMYYPFSITNYLYPILGHSLAWDIFLFIMSKAFNFCIWHRLLIYNLVFNITVEWVMVNFNVPVKYDYIVYGVTGTTIAFLLAAIYFKFKDQFCER